MQIRIFLSCFYTSKQSKVRIRKFQTLIVFEYIRVFVRMSTCICHGYSKQSYSVIRLLWTAFWPCCTCLTGIQHRYFPPGWPIACRALRQDTGGWLHVHDNVTVSSSEIDREGSGAARSPVENRDATDSTEHRKHAAFAVRGSVIVATLEKLLTEIDGSRRWNVDIRHIECVKPYAPRVYHLVRCTVHNYTSYASTCTHAELRSLLVCTLAHA